MKFSRCRDQKNISLEEFYSNHGGKGAKQMLEFLEAFRILPFHRDVFGLTSVLSLKLLAEDDYESTHWVAVEPTRDGIVVSGLLGKPMDGRIDEFRELFRDPMEAAQMALSAMEWSGGWAH